MSRTILLATLVSLTVGLYPAALKAETNYLGAAALLQKIAENPVPIASEKKEPAPSATLKRDIASYRASIPALNPEDAAHNWLALFDRQIQLAETERQRSASFGDSDEEGDDHFDPQDLWMAMPPPKDWDALRLAVEARPPVTGKKAVRETALRLFVHSLVADHKAQTNDVALLQSQAVQLGEDDNSGYAWDRMAAMLAENADDAGAVIAALEHKLTVVSSGDVRQQVPVPDLVTLAGTNKAESFLRRALVSPNVEIVVEGGDEIGALARRLALELVPKLKTPQWKLACSVDASQLYEALDRQFSKPGANDSETNAQPPAEATLEGLRESRRNNYSSKAEAGTYYFLGLIIQGHSKEAVAMARKVGMGDRQALPEEALAQLEQAGHTQELHDFFRELLTEDPDLAFWDEYIHLAAKVGQTGPMLALARKAAAQENLQAERRRSIRMNLISALLAADEVDEGVAEIRQLLAEKEPVPSRSRYGVYYQERNLSELWLRLANIGQLLGRPEWVDAGVAYARAAITNEAGQAGQYGYSSRNTVEQLAQFLAASGRGPEAEQLVSTELAEIVQTSRGNESDPRDQRQKESLMKLSSLYHHAGRFDDVTVLLDRSTGWGARDLVSYYMESSDLFRNEASHGPETASMGQIAADSLLAAGRKADARKVIDAVLDVQGGSDPAYQTLLRTGEPAEVIARLDALFARDQFEERPLIWKAYLLQQAGKLEEAEAVVRQAIAIDPSDGDEGPGDRMRAYAILAELRAARGDTNQAAVFRGAVAAIRLSENADRFYAAGLLKRAVKMYEESLTHFADAYCIQSRLALRLSELGMDDAAEEHYRRAYELMPESFGRVESHCFGCEQAFAGQRAQGIADKVFTRLAEKTPQKPQVHYLLGYLREEQNRGPEALAEYREAVRLDPDYLNAWKKILGIARRQHLPAADRDAVAFNVLRLDPLGRHDCRSFDEVTDLRSLWNAAEVACRQHPSKPATLYPLAASVAEIDAWLAGHKDRTSQHNYYRSWTNLNDRGQQPAGIVLENRFIAAILPLLGGQNDYSYNMMME